MNTNGLNKRIEKLEERDAGFKLLFNPFDYETERDKHEEFIRENVALGYFVMPHHAEGF